MGGKVDVLMETKLESMPLFSRGKVRDTYDMDDRLFMIASDRISAFDSVFPNGIPYKGRVLTQLSLYWFEQLEDIVNNHIISSTVDDFPDEVQDQIDLYDGRSLLVKKTKVIPLECVVRGYLSGSAWREYQDSGIVCGIELPSGLVESDKLDEPIYTPATKAESGHDINISLKEAKKLVGDDVVKELEETSIRLYQKSSELAEKKGIIIADTKFEYGFGRDGIILIDEALTPDSSRFWPQDQYAPGKAQPSFDKQYLRDYLVESGWNKEPPAPEIPDEIVEGTSQRYLEAYQKITGKSLI
ncbi:phosphoribosylaminoimidazolesuccinocarboxamide synthase [Candidatus Altiarchaeota archaeon]